MAFASHCGLEITLDPLRGPALAQLFSEECGVVLQGRDLRAARGSGRSSLSMICSSAVAPSARPLADLRLRVTVGAETLDEPWAELRRAWSETSWQMRRLRDDPDCADEEECRGARQHRAGTALAAEFRPAGGLAAPFIARGARPPIAVLREQGVNSQVENGRGAGACRL